MFNRQKVIQSEAVTLMFTLKDRKGYVCASDLKKKKKFCVISYSALRDVVTKDNC